MRDVTLQMERVARREEVLLATKLEPQLPFLADDDLLTSVDHRFYLTALATGLYRDLERFHARVHQRLGDLFDGDRSVVLRQPPAMSALDQANVRLAKWRYVPDLTTGFNYIDIGDGQTSQPNDGDNAWNVMFTINLPIWEPVLRANLREAKAQAELSRARYEEAQTRTEFEVTDAYVRWETAKNLVDLYRTAVIPQAEQALDAAEAAYRAGQADFLNLLDSERVWLSAQLTYWRAYSDTAKFLAALERAVGVELAAKER